MGDPKPKEQSPIHDVGIGFRLRRSRCLRISVTHDARPGLPVVQTSVTRSQVDRPTESQVPARLMLSQRRTDKVALTFVAEDFLRRAKGQPPALGKIVVSFVRLT
jgi:hypothetical protein